MKRMRTIELVKDEKLGECMIDMTLCGTRRICIISYTCNFDFELMDTDWAEVMERRWE